MLFENRVTSSEYREPNAEQRDQIAYNKEIPYLCLVWVSTELIVYFPLVEMDMDGINGSSKRTSTQRFIAFAYSSPAGKYC